MRSRVISVRKYVAALKMMPTNSPKLSEIHGKAAAYEGAVAGFSSSSKGSMTRTLRSATGPYSRRWKPSRTLRKPTDGI